MWLTILVWRSGPLAQECSTAQTGAALSKSLCPGFFTCQFRQMWSQRFQRPELA
jgi:hypothetical protein